MSSRRTFTKTPGRQKLMSEILADAEAYLPKTPGECWIWSGRKDKTGYGRLCATLAPGKYQTRALHILMYEKYVGPVPPKYEVHHKCEVRLCCNPEHLLAVENRMHKIVHTPRSIAYLNIRKTHCPQGHEYSTKNTGYAPDGSRKCKVCAYGRTKIWRERQRTAGKKFWEKGFRVGA